MPDTTADPTDVPDVPDVSALDDTALAALAEQAAAEQAKRDKITALEAQLDQVLEQMEVLGWDPDEKFAEAKEQRAKKLKEQQERADSVAPADPPEDSTPDPGLLTDDTTATSEAAEAAKQAKTKAAEAAETADANVVGDLL